MKKISVILIGYNIQDYIEKCLKSVLFQSFKDVQIIFIDDGSTDKTLDIATKYKDKICIVSKPNGGIVSARKMGLKYAEGEYVAFVDGDDWLNVDFLANLYAPIEKNNSIDIVCSDFYFQKPDGSFIQEKAINQPVSLCTEFEFFNGIITENIDHHMFPKLYRREFLITAGYYDYPEVTMAEDWMTNAFLGLHKPKVFFSKTTNYFYRFNTNSVLRKGGEKLLEQINTLGYMEEYFAKKCTFEYKQEMEYLWFSYMRTYILGYTKSDVKKKIIKSFKKKKIDIKSNKYCVKSLQCNSKKDKLKKIYLTAEIKFPILIPFIDRLFELAKKYMKRKRINESKAYDRKMNSVFDSYINNLRISSNKKRIYLIGTSDRSNIGDHAIAYSEKKILIENFKDFEICEVTGDTYRKRREEIKEIIKPSDFIFITGGGFLGDLWPEEENMVEAILTDYKDNKIIILPQTVYYFDDGNSPFLEEKLSCYLEHKKLFVLARDQKTYDFFQRYIEKDRVGLFPDMALYLSGISSNEYDNQVMICLRDDKERVVSEKQKLEIIKNLEEKGINVINGSTLAAGKHNGDISLYNREKEIENKLKEFSKVKFILTDRLHGMILSTLAGTPCIVIDNLSKKVSGVYNLWLKNVDSIIYCDDYHEIENNIDKIIKKEHQEYNPKFLDSEKERFIYFLKNVIGD